MPIFEGAIYRTEKIIVRVKAKNADKAADLIMENHCNGEYNKVWADEAETTRLGAYDVTEVDS